MFFLRVLGYAGPTPPTFLRCLPRPNTPPCPHRISIIIIMTQPTASLRIAQSDAPTFTNARVGDVPAL